MDFVALALEHWTFLFFSAMMWTIVQAVKKVVPAPTTSKAAKLFWQTLPLQPMIVGALFGLLSGAPTPATVKGLGKLAGMLYFGGAGVFACYLRDCFQTVVKHKLKNEAEHSIPPPDPTV